MSLSISDGKSGGAGPGGSYTEVPHSLLENSRWFPFVPGPDLSVVGIDGRGLWYHDPQMPITIAMFDTSSRELRDISEIVARIGDEGQLFHLDVCYSSGISHVRLGLDDVVLGEVSSFSIDGPSGERVRGIECYYEHNGGLLGFKVTCSPSIFWLTARGKLSLT